VEGDEAQVGWAVAQVARHLLERHKLLALRIHVLLIHLHSGTRMSAACHERREHSPVDGGEHGRTNCSTFSFFFGSVYAYIEWEQISNSWSSYKHFKEGYHGCPPNGNQIIRGRHSEAFKDKKLGIDFKKEIQQFDWKQTAQRLI
jgi:hypothetical protein